MPTVNSFGTRTALPIAGRTVQMFSLPALAAAGFPEVARLPYSLKILLENLLRNEDGRFVKAADIEALAKWDVKSTAAREISFMPARVLLQDFTGVPCVVDLAAMRDGIARLGGDPNKVNPLQPVELVIDHSVQVDYFGMADAFQKNADLEFARNQERYAFLRWGQSAFNNFRVVPPDTGIVHQVNLEYLARVVMTADSPEGTLAFPDTLVGTDSHTTMVNGLGVVGWGVGGIEAEAAMLGQPSSMLIPPVLGVKLSGRLPAGTTATDLVLTITERLRKHGVVGKFVEFFGPGLEHLTLADRATLGNMCPEYGATIAVFPIDAMTLDYLRLSGRDRARVELVEAYARAQGLFFEKGAADPVYSETIDFNLDAIEPSLAGPKRPQDRVPLKAAKQGFAQALPGMMTAKKAAGGGGTAVAAPPQSAVEHGSVVIAAITSCTNTSNPSVMIGAGLVAKKAVEKGLASKPWVKTSLAPGSKVVTDYLKQSGLDVYLDRLGFNLVGYGCTTCIGNSGPLPEDVSAAIDADSLVVASVLSGNRNFEGRVQQQVRANYLASPPLVVAYALAGTMNLDLTTEPLGTGRDGKACVSERYLAIGARAAGNDARGGQVRTVREAVRRRLPRRRALAEARCPDGQPFCLGQRLHVRAQSSVPRERDDGAVRAAEHRGRACAGPARRQHHHRSHFTCGIHQEGQPGREVPHGARRAAVRLQLVRCTTREPRGHDARDVCEHAAAQPGGAGHGRWLHDILAGCRGDADLRRRDEVQERRRPAARARGQRIRVGVVARLGGERHAAARREGGHCGELRTHSPEQPG